MVQAPRATTLKAAPACPMQAQSPRFPRTAPAPRAGIPKVITVWPTAPPRKMLFLKTARVLPATTRKEITVCKIKRCLDRQDGLAASA